MAHRCVFHESFRVTSISRTLTESPHFLAGLIFWAAVSLACTIARIMILVYQIGAHDLLQAALNVKCLRMLVPFDLAPAASVD